MDFIDDPKFGHTKNRLPVMLVPVIMFACVVLGIIATKIYVKSVVDHHSEESGIQWTGTDLSVILAFNEKEG